MSLTLCHFPAREGKPGATWLEDERGRRHPLSAAESEVAQWRWNTGQPLELAAIQAQAAAQAAPAQAAPGARVRWVPPETMRGLPINSDLAARLNSGMARQWERDALREISAHPEIE